MVGGPKQSAWWTSTAGGLVRHANAMRTHALSMEIDARSITLAAVAPVQVTRVSRWERDFEAPPESLQSPSRGFAEPSRNRFETLSLIRW